MASDYPDSLDPTIPTLRDDVDGFRANGLQHIADMVLAMQGQLGVGLGDMTTDPGFGGSKKFGNLSQMFQSLFRFETGEINFRYSPADIEEINAEPATTVLFTFNRFRAAPFILIQTLECHQDAGADGVGTGSPSEAGYRESKIFPVNVTKSGFGIAISGRAAQQAITTGHLIIAHWLAIEPPFGWAERGDASKG